MPESDWNYLCQMLEMGQKGVDISAGITRQNYDEGDSLQLALAQVIQGVGEAANHVSNEFKDAYPQIPWHEIIGMQQRIVHDDMGVDDEVVWSVVTNDLQPLLDILKVTIPPELQ